MVPTSPPIIGTDVQAVLSTASEFQYKKRQYKKAVIQVSTYMYCRAVVPIAENVLVSTKWGLTMPATQLYVGPFNFHFAVRL